MLSRALPSPRQALSRLTPYVPGKPLQEVQRELELTDVIKLASNENPLGPSPLAVEAMQRALADLALYPDSANRTLQGTLAESLRVRAEQVLIGNGSDEIFRLVAEAYLEPGLEAVVPAPSFSVYESMVRLAGATPVLVPLKDEAMDLEGTLAAVTPRTRVIFLCSPNNPTGRIVPAEGLQVFLDRLPAGVLVLLDEAYGDYVQDQRYPDSLPWVREGRPLLVTRTYSKLYGLAGVRLGYGVGPAALLAPMRLARDPFSVNALAQVAGVAALSDQDHRRRSLAMNEAGKALLYQELGRHGLRFVPTEANFVLIHLGLPARRVFQSLLHQGVIVRPTDSFGLPESIRVTVGTEAQNRRFLDALRQVLSNDSLAV
ncbi:MAG: histidinol-phosphate transaminase [Firmicutes bacterium]|nr:histidinol-phosphate transaminase [Bacillota bacterium]